MIGVRSDGCKELVALTDGYRESTESWADLLRGCRRRGMAAPVLAVGDGALGFWKAVREVFPATSEQRCWFHKQSNVLAALPKSAHPGALAAMRDIYNAEDIDKAQAAIKAFAIDYGAKYPKAVAKIVDDADVLLEFYKYPAEHWIHLRTTNPIESTFATVRLRTKVTKGPGSRRGNCHGLQTHRRRTSPLARGKRPTPRRRGPCRRSRHALQGSRPSMASALRNSTSMFISHRTASHHCCHQRPEYYIPCGHWQVHCDMKCIGKGVRGYILTYSNRGQHFSNSIRQIRASHL
jgi:putative transposase